MVNNFSYTKKDYVKEELEDKKLNYQEKNELRKLINANVDKDTIKAVLDKDNNLDESLFESPDDFDTRFDREFPGEGTIVFSSVSEFNNFFERMIDFK